MTATTTPPGSIEKIISEACACRLPAELCYVDGDGMIIVGQVRMLGCTADEVLADRPQYLDEDGTIPLSRPITMHVSMGGARYQFDTAIVDADRTFRVNDHRTLPGIALRMPTTVGDSQRRTHVRVSLSGYDPISVDLARAHQEFGNACAMDLERACGWMVDLSVGGVSLVADHLLLSSLQRGERFFLSFALPGVDDEFNMLGSVRRTRAVQSGDGVRIALCFCPWDQNRLKRDQHRLARFITGHELRMLRRGR